MNVLALSSSRAGDSGYLEPAIPWINELLGDKPLRLAFVPFASVGSYHDYFQKVQEAFEVLPHSIECVTELNAGQLLTNCEGIVVGGGNTFKLLHNLYQLDVLELIRDKVRSGVPYIGWSAGSNILGATIKTTNDMPIIQPKMFDALQIFPFQINPHYYNQIVAGFNGETRDQRIEEFLRLNKNATVIALPEGSALMMQGSGIFFKGDSRGFLLSYGSDGLKKDQIDNSGSLSEKFKSVADLW